MAPERHPRRVVFLGTPEAAVPSLHALAAGDFEVALVISQPDRRRGRGGAYSASPVKAAALDLNLKVSDTVEDVVGAASDLGVVVAYGEILRPYVLDAVPMVNVHFSLLPRWRGAAPVERALLAGDARTGVCVMEVVEALDAGGVHACQEVAIGPTTTAADLRAELAQVGADLLVRSLRAGLGRPTPQDGEVTYARKINAGELRLDWSRPAQELDRVVRVGGAWTTFRGRRLRVGRAVLHSGVAVAGPVGRLVVGDGAVRVVAEDGMLELLEVQPEGRALQSASAWVNGAHLTTEDGLGW